MPREEKFREQQLAISKQVQVVLESRVVLKEANDSHSIASRAASAAHNAKNEASRVLTAAQSKLDELLKAPPIE